MHKESYSPNSETGITHGERTPLCADGNNTRREDTPLRRRLHTMGEQGTLCAEFSLYTHREAHTRHVHHYPHTQGGTYPACTPLLHTPREALPAYTPLLHTRGGPYPGINHCFTHTGRPIPGYIHCYTHPGRPIPGYIPRYTPMGDPYPGIPPYICLLLPVCR